MTREEELEKRLMQEAKDYADLAEELRLARIGAVTDEEKLKEFARWVISESTWNGTELDGGDVQAKAEHYGLIVETTVTEPCRDGCTCEELVDFPTQCYRASPYLKATG